MGEIGDIGQHRLRLRLPSHSWFFELCNVPLRFENSTLLQDKTETFEPIHALALR